MMADEVESFTTLELEARWYWLDYEESQEELNLACNDALTELVMAAFIAGFLKAREAEK